MIFDLLSSIFDYVEKVYASINTIIYNRYRLIFAEVKKFKEFFSTLKLETRYDITKSNILYSDIKLYTLVDVKQYKQYESIDDISVIANAFKEHKREKQILLTERAELKAIRNISSKINTMNIDFSYFKNHHKLVYNTLYILYNIGKIREKDISTTNINDTSEINKHRYIQTINTINDNILYNRLQIVDKDTQILSYAIVEKIKHNNTLLSSPIIIRSIKFPSNILILR